VTASFRREAALAQIQTHVRLTCSAERKSSATASGSLLRNDMPSLSIILEMRNKNFSSIKLSNSVGFSDGGIFPLLRVRERIADTGGETVMVPKTRRP